MKGTTMKPIQHYVLIAALLAAGGIAAAADIKVIANPGVKADSISSEEVKSIFLLNKSSFSDGGHAEPVLLKSGAAHGDFLKDYVGKSDSALDAYYRSLVFTGKASMPKTFASEADAVSYVAKTKGAIGYVSSATATEGVKVIEVK
jgi:ABC-type phosphate transport system substrate-binding protein